MYENVLVPVDLSAGSRYVGCCLKYIPSLRQAEILHVAYNRDLPETMDPDDPEREYIRLCLEDINRDVRLPGVVVQNIIEEIQSGEIFEAINHVAVREGASLTLMGKRGRGIIETLLLGSVASDVLRYGTTDLLLVNNRWPDDIPPEGDCPPCPDLFSHVLICADFSDPEITSLCCNELPWIRKVTLFHTVTTGDTSEEVSSAVDAAKAVLEKIQDAFARVSVSAQVHVSVGSAAEEIITFSENNDISLIIMKSTGKRDSLLNLLGSTTSQVARDSKKPVLVLRRSKG
jgi:nucleotide-binding universal stress UspA family protein